MFSPKLLLACCLTLALFLDQYSVSAAPRRSARQEEPDFEEGDAEGIPPETSSAGRGFLQRILNVIRGVLTGGKAFLSGQTQRIIEYVTTILSNVMGGPRGSLKTRTSEAERELQKVAHETERYVRQR
ncbi:hypothetical protein TYRP_011340 [Tyrophagus putrescentiae]|nr:hypothetical protein TYRP_011340 [Tyrophagus putrescentiae]